VLAAGVFTFHRRGGRRGGRRARAGRGVGPGRGLLDLVGPAVEPDRNRARLACRSFVACDSAGPEKRRFLSEIVFGKEMHAVSRACFGALPCVIIYIEE